MKKFIFLLTLLICFSLSGAKPALASNNFNSESFYKALSNFLYSFPKMIIDKDNKAFCLFGYDRAVLLIQEKKDKSLVFFTEKSELSKESLTKCKIIYIAKNNDRSSLDIIEIINRANVISISANDHFLEEGGAILIQTSRRGFELLVNHSRIKSYNVSFDPLLSRLIVN